MSNPDESDFGIWCWIEGSAPPKPGEDLEEFTHRIARLAWENGACKERERLEKKFAELEAWVREAKRIMPLSMEQSVELSLRQKAEEK